MKKIINVPLNKNQALNTLVLGSDEFNFVIKKGKYGFEYYLDTNNVFLDIIQHHGYILEDADIDLEGFVDCGGKIGYDFFYKDLVMNPFPIHIQVKELLEILKGYPNDSAIHLRIKFENRMSEASKRKLQLLLNKNKITYSKPLDDYMQAIQFYKVEIRTNHLQLKEQLSKHFNLVFNQLQTLNECTHNYKESEIKLDIFPELYNEENTPYVNLYNLFDNNTSLDIIKQPNKIILGKDKYNEDIGLTINDLLLDVGIFGASGCGKGNLIFSILSQLYGKIPFFVIDPKGEIPNLKNKYQDIKIYDPMVYCPLNIFKIPTGKRLREYLPVLKEIMTMILQLDEAPSAQALVQEAIRKTYYKFNYELNSCWEDGNPFSMRDFSMILKDAIQNSNYAKNEKSNIMQILMNRIANCMDLEQVFDDIHCIDFNQCIKENVIIDLKQTPKEMMGLVMKIILIMMMNEIKNRPSTSNKLQNVLLIDETHNLFGHEDDYFDITFSNSLYELRSLGCGFICCDQRMNLFKASLLDNLTHIINGQLLLCDLPIYFADKEYDNRSTQIMTKLPTGTFSLQVRGTTLKNQVPMLHPVIFKTENIIDEYLNDDSYIHVESSFGSKLYSRCINCKSNSICHNQQRLRDIAHSVFYHYDYHKLSKEEKIQAISNEIQRLGIKKIEFADAINCINFLLHYQAN